MLTRTTLPVCALDAHPHFLQGTFGQPPFHIHKMIADTWEPEGIPVTSTGPLSVSAQRSSDRSKVVLRLVNRNLVPAQASIAVVADTTANQERAVTWSIQNATSLKPPAAGQTQAANSPSSPSAVAPTVETTLLGFKVPTIILVPAYAAMDVVLVQAA